jgi:hypothetical protein
MTDLNSLLSPQIKDLKRKLAEGISSDLRKMLMDRVPIDTRTLQQEGLTVEHYERGNEIIIDCFVNGLDLTHGRQSIKAEVLGLILNIGIRNGKSLLRTQSQPKNPARTQTKGWFSNDFINDVKLYLSENKFMKWLN